MLGAAQNENISDVGKPLGLEEYQGKSSILSIQ